MHYRATTAALAAFSTLAVSLPITSATAADGDLGALIPAQKDRFKLSYRAGFNIKASFRGLGGGTPASNPGGTGPDQDHTYDDGYVRRDSGNGDGLTWNWGYIDAAQVPGNDTIEFHSSRSAGDGKIDGDRSRVQHGIELGYQRYLGTWKQVHWGLDTAFNYMPICIKENGATTGTAIRTTDVYPLGGVIPPAPVYNGDFTGPGPLIGDTPIRSTTAIAGGANITGRHELNADLYGFKVGAYGEIPATTNFTLQVSAGFAWGVIDGEFRYNETVAIGSIPGGGGAGRKEGTCVRVGAYAGLDAAFDLDEQWSLFVGAQYQYLEQFSLRSGGRRAELDFSGAVYLRAGLGFAF